MSLAANQFEDYEVFKEQSSHLLYDYYYPHKLDWPASCCRWGGVKQKTEQFQQQDVFFGCRTDGKYHEKVKAWQGLGSLLVMGTVDIPQVGYKLEKEQKRMAMGKKFDPNQRIEVQKIVVHPGEINCLKCWPKNQKIIATHSDSKNVYLWDFNAQKNAHDRINIEASPPDLILEGHTDIAAYALDWSSQEPIVASGGRDRQILLWNVDHYFNSHGKIPEEEKDFSNNDNSEDPSEQQQQQQQSLSRIQKSLKSYLTDSKKEPKYKLEPFIRLQGHSGNIEDLVFRYDSPSELVSVGIDRYVLFWDTRVSNKPVNKALQVHFDDINTVDWSRTDPNYIATGSNDMKVSLLDIRKLTNSDTPALSKEQRCPAVVSQLEGHTNSINVVRFSPFSKDYIASSGESLIIWDLSKQASEDTLFFKHAGHVGQIVDFEWNQFQPWSFISASDDIDQPIPGYSLQLFRPIDLLLMDDQEASQALEMYIE